MDQIEARNFSWVSAFYPNELTHMHFVVMTPDRKEAEKRAMDYATLAWGKPETVRVYPRTYVRKARKAYAEGYHD